MQILYWSVVVKRTGCKGEVVCLLADLHFTCGCELWVWPKESDCGYAADMSFLWWPECLLGKSRTYWRWCLGRRRSVHVSLDSSDLSDLITITVSLSQTVDKTIPLSSSSPSFSLMSILTFNFSLLVKVSCLIYAASWLQSSFLLTWTWMWDALHLHVWVNVVIFA